MANLIKKNITIVFNAVVAIDDEANIDTFLKNNVAWVADPQAPNGDVVSMRYQSFEFLPSSRLSPIKKR